jgi:hypothetical protein
LIRTSARLNPCISNPKKEAEMFDTLRYSKILEAVGIPREHAEAQIRIMAEIVEGDLATKQDIRDLKMEMQALEYRLVIKMGALVTAVVALAVTILKLT